MAAVQVERIPGGFILITGIDGIRYAARHHAVVVIHDIGECHDETLDSYMVGPSSGFSWSSGSRDRRLLSSAVAPWTS